MKRVERYKKRKEKRKIIKKESEIREKMKEKKERRPEKKGEGEEMRQHIIVMMLSANQDGECKCSGMRVGEIAALTSLSRPAGSHHLQILKAAGILSMRKEGTKNYYYFDWHMDTMERLINLLEHTKSLMSLMPDRSGEE